MINSLTIKNFQSHKKNKLVFDKGINMIIGQTDAGKSGIIRALSWGITNKPSGEEFRSDWGGLTRVSIKLDDKKIDRVKGTNRNTYNLKWEGKHSEFKSFGQDVPKDIKELVNFSPLNMAGQFDSPFLLSVSGGEVAKYLNKIVQLDKIDLSLTNINRVLRQEQTELRYKEKELREVEEKLGEFHWIQEAEGQLVALEAAQSKMSDKKGKANELSDLLKVLKEYDAKLDVVWETSQHKEVVDKLIREQEEVIARRQAANRLNELIENILIKEGQIRTIEKNLSSWEYEFKSRMPDICPLCGRGAE